ncbi:TraB/GumN family protein [Chryseobacterium soli]|uniref:TraB/GumN family protein n=1 Tax=Chryseobacterium soli TaxID=445961 RepID=UPI0029529FBB|nr:TraB/GumN family protein [Chryseobacterium soli]MDV7696443.1 TraB/GumN family protein [Chryseobacterium soli]
MKTFVQLGFAALISCMSLAVKAQNKISDDNKSLLWEVSGNGISKPSYIMGTFHMICSKDFEIKPKVTKALENSDNLILEINYTDANEMAAMQKMLSSDQKISDKLSPKEAKELDAILSEYGTTLQNVNSYSPHALYSLISTKAIPCPQTEVKMYEIELLKKALQNKKHIGALEKVDDQSHAIGGAYTLKDAISQLKMGNEYAIVAQKMVESFKKEDLQTLDRLVKDKRFMNKDQEKIMLTDRNKSWAEKMPEIMKNQSSFFAVGSAHLLGDNGLINLLRTKGYTVNPVKNQ